jgi:hypothetical protein
VSAQRRLNAEHHEARSATAERTGPQPSASANGADRASRAMDASPTPSQPGPSRGSGRS